MIGKKKKTNDSEKKKKKKNDTPFFKRLLNWGENAYNFVDDEMWQTYTTEAKGFRGKMTNLLKVVYVAITEFIEGNVSRKASALTYTTILSIVPLLAILLSIAAGFGVKDSVQRQLFEYFPAHRAELAQGLEFAAKYMEQIKGGFIIGVGVVILLWAVISLLSSIEDTINDVWHINKRRSWSQRLLGYLAAFIILPVLMTISSGSNIFISSFENTTIGGAISLTPLITFILHLASFLIVVGIFTSMFILFPNTKVSFKAGLIGGLVAGVAFQVFQQIYISGMLWVTKYNAIYGSFAAIPLLLLFVQLSWIICLFGAQLSYAIDNIELYAFKSARDNVTRRFKDFVAIILMKEISIAFREQEDPYTAGELSAKTKVPITVINETIEALIKCELIKEIPNEKEPYSPQYMPNMDIHLITVQVVLNSLDSLGFEDFKDITFEKYHKEWETILLSREIVNDECLNTLVINI